LQPIVVDVTQFELVERSGPDVRFSADVSSGTYVRSLARELGERLGCGAHLASLRRHSTGPFHVEEAVRLEQPPDRLRNALRPPRDAVRHLAAVAVDEAACEELRHGRPVSVPPTVGGEGPAALVAADGRLVAIAELREGEARPLVVLAP
jgi:tRNA pseudouridine55 synthase